MNIYRISQSQNADYDTFDSAIVAAESEDDARLINPGCDWGTRFSAWCKAPSDVTVELIGEALKGTPQGVLLASFNAG